MINDENIADVFIRWTALIGQKSLRLALTIQQAAGTGLTTLIVIGNAIKSYPDFDWAQVRLHFPQEWNNFTRAVQVVNNNPYYGYRKDLGVVKSTLYKNLSYIAKELLIKVGGQQSLTQYAEFPVRIPDKAGFDVLISDYEAAHAGQAYTQEQIAEQELRLQTW